MRTALGMLLSLVALAGVSAGAMVQWQPSDRAQGYRIYQGVASGLYDIVLDVGPATQAVISGLIVEQTYVFAVTAYNTAGESDYSAEVAYTVPEAPPMDTIPPMVQWLAPPDGSRVSRKGLVTLEATATDAGGLAHLAFSVNGQVTCTVITAPYRCVWTVPSSAKRRYALQAVATDVSGNVGVSALITVTSK